MVEQVRVAGLENLALCSVVKAKLWFGACKSDQIIANQAVLMDFFAQFSSYPFDDLAIAHYGEIRAFLAKAGKPSVVMIY